MTRRRTIASVVVAAAIGACAPAEITLVAAQGGASGASGSAGTGGAGTGGAGTGGAGTGGGGGTGGTGPLDGPCTSNANCNGGQVCSKIDTNAEKLNCQTPNASGAEVGQVCAGNGACKTKACDTTGGKACTLACGADSECGSGNSCVKVPYSQAFQPNLCMKECKRDGDCPVNGFGTQTCILSENVVSDAILFTCGFFAPIGAATSSGGTFKDWGQEMGANDACVYAVQLTAGGKLYCTRPCVTAADCGGALPACNKGGIGNPSGSGSSIISVCGT